MGTGPLRFARMVGSSIAGPSAGEWVTDFLNAAYFARPPGKRDVADLRLAFCVLTTRWAARPERRLQAFDLGAFHRAFGALRLRGRPWLTLDRDALLAGGDRLLGDWFSAAALDPERRAHGIAFEDAAARAAFDPALRRRHAALGDLTAPLAAPHEQRWHTYPAVPLPDPQAALAALLAPERWPDAGSELGRFTALCAGGLRGQTFEIEVVARPAPLAPVFTRGYVTCTALLEAGAELDAWTADVDEAMARACPDQPAALPDGAEPVLAVELTTHEGHFLGRAVSRLLVFEDDGGTWIRDVGSWDPLPWHLAGAYALEGRRAQEAFWAPGPEATSMLTGFAQAARIA